MGVPNSVHFVSAENGNERRHKRKVETNWMNPGKFKLEYLQSFEPILFWKFSICFTFILGAHFLLPQRPIMEKL